MKICITGFPGSGKSLTMQYLKECGKNIFISDQYVHEIYHHDQIGYRTIKENFGDDFVNDTEVDRKKLGSLVFKDPEALNKLNKLINPLIYQKILELDDKNGPIYIELGTYLFYYEFFSDLFDKIVFIYRSDLKLDDKFSYLKNKPTIFVGNSIKITKNSLEFKRNDYPSKTCKINVDYFVDNSKNKNNLKKIITSFLSCFEY